MPNTGTRRHPFFPEQHGVEVSVSLPPTRSPRRRWVWVFTAFVAALLGVRLAANPIAGVLTKQALGDGGTFASVNVSFIPPRYELRDLQLERGVTVDQLDIEPGSVVAQGAKFVVRDFGFTRALGELPFDFSRLEVRDSEIELVEPKLRVTNVQFVVEKPTTDSPMLMSGRARVAESGVLSMFVVVDSTGAVPVINGQAQLSGLRLESLHELAKERAGVSPHGTLFIGVNMNTVNEKLAGDVEVVAWDVKLDGLYDSLLNELKANVVNIAFKALADSNGRASVRLPLRAELNDVHPKVWPTVLRVVSEALVNAVDFGFGTRPVINLERAGEHARDEDRLVFSKNTRVIVREDGIRALQAKLNVTPSGALDADTQRALGAFQRAQELTETGMPDSATVKQLGIDPRRVFRRNGSTQ